MRAQINYTDEVLTPSIILDNEEEERDIWNDIEELVELSDEEVKLVLEYRELSKRYWDMCEEKLRIKRLKCL
jgi:hypothetical protein